MTINIPRLPVGDRSPLVFVERGDACQRAAYLLKRTRKPWAIWRWPVSAEVQWIVDVDSDGNRAWYGREPWEAQP